MYCWVDSDGPACMERKTHPRFGRGLDLSEATKVLRVRAPLLFLFFFLSSLWTLCLCLRLGLFHRFLGFGNPLGAGFGAFFTLLIKDLFAAQKLDERLFRSIALLPCRAHDAQIPAIAIAKAGRDGVEQLDHGFVGHQVRRGEAASREIATLAQCDHLFDMWAHGFRLRDRGLDPLFHNQRSHQVPQQRPAVRSISSKFPASYFVTHSKNLKKFRVSGFKFRVISRAGSGHVRSKLETRNLKPHSYSSSSAPYADAGSTWFEVGPGTALPCSSIFMPRLSPIEERISLISFSDLRPKFFVFSISASVFCTSSPMVWIFAFFKQL